MTETGVTFRRGSLYIPCALYDLYFASLESVILLRKDEDLLILPVRHAAAGGYLLKRRNGAGDRVVTAPDFFRHHGLNDDAECDVSVAWSAEAAGLIWSSAFSANKVCSS